MKGAAIQSAHLRGLAMPCGAVHGLGSGREILPPLRERCCLQTKRRALDRTRSPLSPRKFASCMLRRPKLLFTPRAVKYRLQLLSADAALDENSDFADKTKCGTGFPARSIIHAGSGSRVPNWSKKALVRDRGMIGAPSGSVHDFDTILVFAVHQNEGPPTPFCHVRASPSDDTTGRFG